MEAGKTFDHTTRSATFDEVKYLRREARALKEVLTEQAVELRLRKKAQLRIGRTMNKMHRVREAGVHEAVQMIADSCHGHAV